jgi:hypothetical protein
MAAAAGILFLEPVFVIHSARHWIEASFVEAVLAARMWGRTSGSEIIDWASLAAAP